MDKSQVHDDDTKRFAAQLIHVLDPKDSTKKEKIIDEINFHIIKDDSIQKYVNKLLWMFREFQKLKFLIRCIA